MVLRVLDTLVEAREIDSLIVCGPAKALLAHEPELLALITAGKVRWFQNQATPSLSTSYVLDSLSHDAPALVTTADHAFLNAKIVNYFCRKARASGCDVVVGLTSHEEVMRVYPQTRRTARVISSPF
jgi:GTP:adenosylcobinamide-phosphate guanylyltransferase